MSSDGLIITNAHLISENKIVSIITSDNRQLECQIEAIHPPTNLTLLRIPNASLLPLLFQLNAPPRIKKPLVTLSTPYHPALNHSISQNRITTLDKKKVGTNIQISPNNNNSPLLDGYERIVTIVN